MLRLFRTTDFVPADVQIVVSMPDDAGRIEGDADILKQILVNLVKNAIEALPAAAAASRSPTAATSTASAGCTWNWSSADTGPGLSRDVLANLFSAVKSTKEGAAPRPRPVDRAQPGQEAARA